MTNRPSFMRPMSTATCGWAVGLVACLCGVVAAAEVTPAHAPGPMDDSAESAASAQIIVIDALVAEGQTALDSGELGRAERAFRQAVALAPQREDAQMGLRQAVTVQSGQPGVEMPVNSASPSVADQVATAEARAAVERAELLARQGKPEAARDALMRARVALQSVRVRTDIEASVRRVEGLLAQIEPVVVDREQAGAASARKDALTAAEQQAEVQPTRRASILSERIERIRGQQRRHLYELALSGALALVRDFPGNPEAEALYEELLTQVHEQRNHDLVEQKAELLKEVHRRLEDSLIPVGWDANPMYPIDWLERDTRPLELGDETTALEPWEEALADRLAQRVSLAFEDAPIDEALTSLAKIGAFNLVVDPAVYVNGGTPIQLRVADMRIDHVLNWLAQMSDQSWTLSKGAVYFGGSVDYLRTLAVYDLGYLLRVPGDQAGMGIGFGSGGGGGNSFALFERDDANVVTLAPEDVVDLIQMAVSPSTWQDANNVIEIRGNQLYVTAPKAVHHLLQEFIRSQANARALAVHIKARWLSVTDQSLEEIGVNWGSAENLLSADGFGWPPGVTHANSTNSVYGNALNRIPAVAMPIAPATQGTGLNLSMLRLGNTQVSAVLTAVERKGDGRVLSSPEFITLNGVRGNVFAGTQYAYIADYEVVNNNLDPVIEVLNIGASLDIKPYVSADRKYVTMEFKPAIASVSFYTELITAPRIITTGNGGGVVILDQSFPIELPNVEINEASTTVMVPDKGSLLVGGFTHVINESASSKVPFLGHIPFVGRLFGSRGRYNLREKIFLLANVRIIDYQEAEDRL